MQRWFSIVALMWLAVARAANPNPFTVQELRVEWRDAIRDRTIPATIYYPTNATSACPVIVFSHGLGGSRDGYSFLGRHWAANGYVSVHVQHHGSDETVWRGAARPLEAMRAATLDPLNAAQRPVDVSFAIDELKKMNTTGALKGKLDLTRIGAAGHSFGAWTTMALAGQRFGPNDKSFADERIKAAIALSSPVPRIAAERKYDQVTIPILHMTGTEDNSPIGDTAAADRRIPYDLTTNGTAFLVIFKGGDHMIFSGPTPRRATTKPHAAMHEAIKESTTQFWDTYLRGEGKRTLDTNTLRAAIGTLGTVEARLR